MRLGRRDKKLTGERVELRRHRRESYPLYREWYGNHEVWRLTSWMSGPMEPAAADRLIQDRELSPSDDSFAIHRLGESDPIGIISLMNISRSKGSADLSIIVGPEEARRQGYGPEAIGLLLDYGFERLGLQRVGLSVFEFNETAILTYQRLGFHKEGRLRQAVEREGILHDAILMSLPKSEWSGSNRRRRT